MESESKVIDIDKIIGGYTLSVKDDWVLKIKKIHISEYEKDLYLEEFGDTMITFNEFYKWFKTIKKTVAR
jgi:hypothetical protein